MSWLAGNLLVASLLVAAVLVVRRPVACLFGPRAAYALWLAPALRLILPPLPEISAARAPGGGETVGWMLVTGERAVAASGQLPWLWWLWGAGAAAMLAVHLIIHQRFLARALAQGRPLDAPDVPHHVIATRAVGGPVATGLVRTLILVPEDFAERFTPEQQHFALWHEQLHHARGDLWAATLALVTASALWFNPLTHFALRAFRRDMEAACDAALMARAGRPAASAYARTILRCAAQPVPRSLCALTSIDELKGRLKMLSSNHGKIAKAAGLVLAGGLALGGLAILPAVAGDPKPATETVEIRKIVHGGDGKRVVSEAVIKDCPGQRFEVSADSSTGGNRKQVAKIKLCLEGATKAETATRIESVIADLDKSDDMDTALKAHLKTKLAAKLAELQAAN